jgi:hypothetical protein
VTREVIRNHDTKVLAVHIRRALNHAANGTDHHIIKTIKSERMEQAESMGEVDVYDSSQNTSKEESLCEAVTCMGG